MKAGALTAAIAIAAVLVPCELLAQRSVATLTVRVDSQATAVATAGLSTFRALVRQQKNFREMGFEKPGELDRATLGEPLAQYMVRLDELESFKAGADPVRLLHDTRQLMFPVLVGGNVRSSITIAAAEKGWAATGFGSAGKAVMAVRTRDVSVQATQLAPSAFVLVEVPAMKLVFIGYGAGGSLVLRPLTDYPAFGLKADTAAKADEVFSRLAPATQAFRDAPG